MYPDSQTNYSYELVVFNESKSFFFYHYNYTVIHKLTTLMSQFTRFHTSYTEQNQVIESLFDIKQQVIIIFKDIKMKICTLLFNVSTAY